MNGAGTSRKASGYNSGPGMNVRTRPCTGGCKKAYSIPQFIGTGTICAKCRRRTPRQKKGNP